MDTTSDTRPIGSRPKRIDLELRKMLEERQSWAREASLRLANLRDDIHILEELLKYLAAADAERS